MIAIHALAAYVGLAIRTTRLIARDRALFKEFNVPTTLGVWVWLFPVPAIMALFPASVLSCLMFGCGAAIPFFVPGLVAASHARRLFQTAGTDRVDRAQRGADEVVLGAIIGIIVVLACCLIFWLCHLGVTTT
jgi:hypothetical protein